MPVVDESNSASHTYGGRGVQRTMRDRLRLYDYPASANCYKVRLLFAQLGLDYERVVIDIFDGDTLTAAYAQINPMRTTPVLELATAGASRSPMRSSSTWPAAPGSCPRTRSGSPR